MPDDELARLQARAYGPTPDLDSDPVALARLRELEDAQREAHAADARVAPEPAPPARPDGAPVGRAEEDAVLTSLGFAPDRAADTPIAPSPAELVTPRTPAARADPVDPADPADPAEPRASDPRTAVLSRRTRTAWAVSLVAAVVIGAGVTAWTFPWGVRDDAHHAARLPAQAGEAPQGIVSQFGFGVADAESVQFFGHYFGVGVYATQDCIQAVLGDGDRAITGGCAGGGISPIMDLYVPSSDRTEMYGDVDFPDELLQRFPDGGMLRFTLDGDVILVDEGEIPGAYR